MSRKTKKLSANDAKAAEEYFSEDVFEEAGLPDTRWQRGVSGNPAGRPVEPDGLTEMLGFRLTKALRKQLADKLISLALNGNLNAITYVYDRIEGRPRQSILNKNEDESPIVTILRGLVVGNAEARRVPARRRPAALPAGPVNDAEVSGESGPSAGAGVQ